MDGVSSQNDLEPGAFRPLATNERLMLDALLAADFPGNAALRKQAATVLAHPIDPEGSLVLTASADAPVANVLRRVPVEAEVEDVDGVTVHVLLHVLDGFLNELEIFREDSGSIEQPIELSELRVIVL